MFVFPFLHCSIVRQFVEVTALSCRVLAVNVMPQTRRNILADLLTVYANAGKTIVFTQTKREADEVAAGIAGVIPSEVHCSMPSKSACLRQRYSVSIPSKTCMFT